MTPQEKILIGSTELFFKYGIKTITMDDVAKHLGMSKKTIYQFYSDKDELVLAVSKNQSCNHEIEFAQLTKIAKDPIHETLLAAEAMKVMFTKINPVLFYDLQKFYPSAWKNFQEFKQSCLLNMVEENLLNGIKAGLYRKNIDVKILSKYRIEQVELAMNFNAFPPEKYNFTKVQVELLDHFLHGICTLKGHKLLNKYQQIIEEE